MPVAAAFWKGVPARVRAKHRGARRKGKGSRVNRSIGLVSSFIGYPSRSLRQLIRYRPNDRLAAGINVHVFDPNRLFAAALEFGQSIGEPNAFSRSSTEPPLWAVKPHFALKWIGGFGTHSGPSRGGFCRGAIRPIEASKAAVSYVR